jgi:hypothetical protein
MEIVQGYLFLHATDDSEPARVIGMPLPHDKAREIGEMMGKYVAVEENATSLEMEF